MMGTVARVAWVLVPWTCSSPASRFDVVPAQGECLGDAEAGVGMKPPALITKFRQRRARKQHECDKALRAQQDERAMDRVIEVAGNIGGGGGMSGGGA